MRLCMPTFQFNTLNPPFANTMLGDVIYLKKGCLFKQPIKVLKTISLGLIFVCIIPLVVMIYLVYCSAISIDYINNVGIIQNDKTNRERSKKVNFLPLVASSLIGTLIFFNIYIYFRNHLLVISNHYLILSLKEIMFMQVLILIVIDLLMLLKPKQIKVLKRGNS